MTNAQNEIEVGRIYTSLATGMVVFCDVYVRPVAVNGLTITTLATAAERFDVALEKLSLAIDEMDDDSARQAEELELEANLSLLREAQQLLGKLKELQPPAADAMATQAPADTRNDVVLHQLLEN